MPELIPSQRHLFDLPADVAYLNCAYMSPLSKRAAAIGAAAIARKAQPWRISARDFFTDSERARALFAELLGTRADDVALVPAASYGLAVAAANLPASPGGRILVLAEQFPSNVYTWRALAARSGAEVVTVQRPVDGNWTDALLARLDERVAIAALPHCHWIDGGLLDLAAIGARCREVGSALVVDVTQSLGALPLELAAVRPDYLVCAGYKWLLGPYSLGYSTSRRRTRAAGRSSRTGSRAPAARTSLASSTTRNAISRARAGSTWASVPILRLCR